MILNSVKITNFRQYRDDEFNLEPDDDKNFIIIQGMNGAGKSNFMNAITWCLYGEEHHKAQKKYEGLPLVNLATINETEKGENCQVKVELHMSDNETVIIIRRELNFKKIDDEHLKVIEYTESQNDGSIFEICRLKGNEWETTYDPNFKINQLMPKDILEYFFFDGEQLNYYFKDRSGEKIYDAVFQISQLTLLDSLIDHLTKRRRFFRKKLKDSSPKAEEIAKELEALEHRISTLQDEFKDIKIQLAEASLKEDEYNRKLISSSHGKLKELRQSREDLLEDIETIEDNISNLENELEIQILQMAPIVFSFECITKTIKLIKERGDWGELPPNIKKEFIEKLIHENKCICGTDLSENESCKVQLYELMESVGDISDISEEVIGLNSKLGSLIKELNNYKRQKNRLIQDITKFKDQKKTKDTRLNEIEMELKDTNDDESDYWEQKLVEYRRLRSSLTDRKASCKLKIKSNQKQLENRKKDLQIELNKSKVHKNLKKILGFCDDSWDASANLMDEIMKDIRLEVEEKTNNQFFNLIWKEKTFTNVIIDETYNVSVTHVSGYNALPDLSAGEIQVLALSFMAALNTVSGFKVPIIIDTPLGKLGRKPKINIAKNLPKYLKGRQVIMLVTEEEYTEDVRNALSLRVGKEYSIKFTESENGGESKVISYEKI